MKLAEYSRLSLAVSCVLFEPASIPNVNVSANDNAGEGSGKSLRRVYLDYDRP